MKASPVVIYIWLCSALLASCDREQKLFQKMLPGKTGIDFSNRIIETDTFNILKFEYVYNGGGVGIADFNNDGLQDLFFSGNMVDNRLYLNQGGWKFRDVSREAGVEGKDRWSSGVAVVDINNDGWLDLYVCSTTYDPAERRTNQLFVNQGAGEGGSPFFREMAEEYGIADTTHTTTAAFFDFDNDGDLDLYVAVNRMDTRIAPNAYWREGDPRFAVNADRLYENFSESPAGHPVFRDVSALAGITRGGFTLGLNIVDIDRDGWKDIYVANDYNSPDMLFMNNGDGTFTDRSGEYFKHTCYSAMGMDVGDLNNDGLADIFVLDMLPEENLRRKAMLQPYNYMSYLNNERFGYPYQYVRNTLQLNRGLRPDNGELIFSEVGMFAGVHATDWSWTPMLADFDHDQFRDLVITNGFPKDITDLDFGDFMTMRRNFVSNEMSLQALPSKKLHNYAFRNELETPGGIPLFSKVSEEWGITEASFSSSAAYGDLDNDGDLDYVVSNIDDSAFVYRNMVEEKETENSNWLKIGFRGGQKNINGVGAIVELFYGDRMQMWENSPYRGYNSSVQMGAHFGLGEVTFLDSLSVEWPGGREQVLYNVPVNQELTVEYGNSLPLRTDRHEDPPRLFREVSRESGIDYLHPESDYIDFNVQRLLPHKLSQYGPGVAVSDVNMDGLDDFYVGGSHFNKGRFFIQQAGGTFLEKDLLPGPEGEEKREEELGILFFDADRDGDEDLYLVSGGYEFDIRDSSYQDRLFLNENGEFIHAADALPRFLSSGSCVKAADFDHDGDLDLFVGGRVIPHNYPLPASSYLLINDGRGIFSTGNGSHAPVLEEIGLISDALWTDFDNDGWADLLLAGEWMPLTLLKNRSGKLEEFIRIGEGKAVGWWNSLASGDFDMDGDMDYVAGNVGSNSLIRVTDRSPVSIYAGDYNLDGILDAIPTNYYLDERGKEDEFPFFGLNDMVKQVKEFREIFRGHKDFGTATIDEVMARLPEQTQLLLRVNYQMTGYFENLGNGDFKVQELPAEAQTAPVFAILTGDFTDDGLPDILLTGNDYGNEIGNGRHDALNGLMLQGDGRGNFETLSMQQSGIIIPGDGKSLAKMRSADGTLMVVSGQNRGRLGLFRSQLPCRSISLEPDDQAVIVRLQDGRTYREEVYFGNSYLSHSTRRLWLPRQAESLEIINFSGAGRKVDLTD